MAKKIEGYIKLQIPAGKANPSPPVGPALGQHHREFIRQDGLQEWDVLIGNLFLEIDGIGGDDDRLFGG